MIKKSPHKTDAREAIAQTPLTPENGWASKPNNGTIKALVFPRVTISITQMRSSRAKGDARLKPKLKCFVTVTRWIVG